MNIIIRDIYRCQECPCLRNDQYGFKCFVTEEDLTYHNVDIALEVGRNCPGFDNDDSFECNRYGRQRILKGEDD